MNFTDINFDYVSQTLSNVFTNTPLQGPLLEGRSLDCLEESMPLLGVTALGLIITATTFNKVFDTNGPRPIKIRSYKWAALSLGCCALATVLCVYSKILKEQCHFRP